MGLPDAIREMASLLSVAAGSLKDLTTDLDQGHRSLIDEVAQIAVRLREISEELTRLAQD